MENFHTQCVDALHAVRTHHPLVGAITNSVVTNFTANALLAIGAAPAMVDIPGESGPFAAIANAVLINLGTPKPTQCEAALESATSANEAGTCWVLDPVAIGPLPVRTQLAHQLVALGPSIVRGNPSEIIALAGLGEGGRGVDSADAVDAAIDAARRINSEYGSLVAVSGKSDAIVSADAIVRVEGGSDMLTRITGAGCSLGALAGAFASVARTQLDGLVAVHALYAAASEIAAERARGTGTFQMEFLDALDNFRDEDFERVTIIAQ